MSGEFKAQDNKTASQKWVERQLADIHLAVACNTASIASIIDDLANSISQEVSQEAARKAEEVKNKLIKYMVDSGNNLSVGEKTDLIAGLVNYIALKENL